MKTLIKAALGLSVAALLCAIPEWLAPLMTPQMFLAAMIAGIAALVVWTWREYREAIEINRLYEDLTGKNAEQFDALIENLPPRMWVE